MAAYEAKREYERLFDAAMKRHGAVFDEDADRLQALAERLDIKLGWQSIELGFPSVTHEGRHRG